MVGDTHEEFGFGFNIGLNLIIYVLKQATNCWLSSQGSGEMGNLPTQQMGSVFTFILTKITDHKLHGGRVSHISGNPVKDAKG